MATSINLLRVPIRVDALYVSPKDGGGYPLGAFTADFSTLPYCVSNGTQNDQNPNFGLTLVGSLPSSLTFPPGLHLHWALPDALANGRHDEKGTRFPAVPNRWLVRRFDDKRTLQKAWIVESDFLHPCDSTGNPTVLPPPQDQGHPITAWPNGNPITFPTRRFHLSSESPGAAFRYMGRSLLLSDWLKNAGGGSDQYLNQDANSAYKLTALGYGEPTFAAYYPNCYSVFGFCDVDPTLDGAASYEYEIVGWFQESGLDPLQAKEFKDLFRDDPARFVALAKEYRWLVDKDDANRAFPDRMVCYASLAIVPNSATPWKPSDGEKVDKVDIAIGNTGGEAFSALLADEFAQDQASGDPDQAQINADRGRPTRGDEPGVVAPRRVGRLRGPVRSNPPPARFLGRSRRDPMGRAPQTDETRLRRRSGRHAATAAARRRRARARRPERGARRLRHGATGGRRAALPGFLRLA